MSGAQELADALILVLEGVIVALLARIGMKVGQRRRDGRGGPPQDGTGKG